MVWSLSFVFFCSNFPHFLFLSDLQHQIRKTCFWVLLSEVRTFSLSDTCVHLRSTKWTSCISIWARAEAGGAALWIREYLFGNVEKRVSTLKRREAVSRKLPQTIGRRIHGRPACVRGSRGLLWRFPPAGVEPFGPGEPVPSAPTRRKEGRGGSQEIEDDAVRTWRGWDRNMGGVGAALHPCTVDVLIDSVRFSFCARHGVFHADSGWGSVCRSSSSIHARARVVLQIMFLKSSDALIKGRRCRSASAGRKWDIFRCKV